MQEKLDSGDKDWNLVIAPPVASGNQFDCIA
jgi:hypothetical protein